VTYWHFACEAHEIIRANGAWAETLYPGPMAGAALPAAAQEELLAIMGPDGLGPLARPAPPLRRQTRLVGRVRRNAGKRCLVEPRVG
jgi:hypothetical protein